MIDLKVDGQRAITILAMKNLNQVWEMNKQMGTKRAILNRLINLTILDTERPNKISKLKINRGYEALNWLDKSYRFGYEKLKSKMGNEQKMGTNRSALNRLNKSYNLGYEKNK